jgi:hypothetical protein
VHAGLKVQVGPVALAQVAGEADGIADAQLLAGDDVRARQVPEQDVVALLQLHQNVVRTVVVRFPPAHCHHRAGPTGKDRGADGGVEIDRLMHPVTLGAPETRIEGFDGDRGAPVPEENVVAALPPGAGLGVHRRGGPEQEDR